MKISVPKTKVGQFIFFFCTQCFSYFIIVANTRAYTQGNYLWTGITDALFASQNFLMIRIISKQDEATGLWAGMGYTIGGTVGSLISIWVTKCLYWGLMYTSKICIFGGNFDVYFK